MLQGKVYVIKLFEFLPVLIARMCLAQSSMQCNLLIAHVKLRPEGAAVGQSHTCSRQADNRETEIIVRQEPQNLNAQVVVSQTWQEALFVDFEPRLLQS